MRNIQKQVTQLNSDLKRCMDECKEIYLKHIERLQRERDTALLAASQIEDPNNINAQLPPGVEISNKKVKFYLILFKFLQNNLNFTSALTAIVMPWLNVLCVEEHLTAQHFVSARTGSRIRMNAFAIMSRHNKLC